jgi:predicted porin
MKKSLIALAALATVAGAAQAQSSVSIYGIIDSGYLSTESDRVSINANGVGKKEAFESKGVGSNSSASSRLGFRGTEDLGGGLKAEFVFETNLAATNSTMSDMGNRLSFIGLTGGFGTLRVGTQYTAQHTLAAAFSPSTGVNIAGDLNYSKGASAGLASTLGLTSTPYTTSTYTSTKRTTATTAELNDALIEAKLQNAGVTAAEDVSPRSANGIIVSSGTTVAATRALVNQILDAKAVAAQNTRLARIDMAGYTVRANNMLTYTSPKMSGLQVGLQYNAPQTSQVEGGAQSKASAQTISLNYAAGKFGAAVAYGSNKAETVTTKAAVNAADFSAPFATTTTITTTTGAIASVNPTLASTATDTSVAGETTTLPANGPAVTGAAATTERVEVKGTSTMVGLSYDFGFAKLGYIYSARDAKDTVSDLMNRKAHSVNASVPVTAKVTAFANYGDGEQTMLESTANEAKYDLKSMQVGARYAFSKRTDAYVIYGQTKMDAKAATGLDLKDTQYAFGVRHSF